MLGHPEKYIDVEKIKAEVEAKKIAKEKAHWDRIADILWFDASFMIGMTISYVCFQATFDSILEGIYAGYMKLTNPEHLLNLWNQSQDQANEMINAQLPVINNMWATANYQADQILSMSLASTADVMFY
mgnify:CR=1 FL=1